MLHMYLYVAELHAKCFEKLKAISKYKLLLLDAKVDFLKCDSFSTEK